MALAPLAYTLFKRFLELNPRDPDWPDRDRFVLSSGHACVLQYSLLHLTGYDLEHRGSEAVPPVGLAHARASRARAHAGHRGHDRAARSGLRATPSAWRWPSASSPSASTGPGSEVVDHRTYAICSDGDMMEGISQEAASIAGHFGLGKLIVCYDDNRITIDGTTSISFDGENHAERLPPTAGTCSGSSDSEDLDALEAALSAAREEVERPSFISIRSHIAYPAPHAVDTAAAHGAPLGEDGGQGRRRW